MPDLVLSLTELENVVLSIAAEDRPVHPIGPWEKAIKSLVSRGLMQQQDPGIGGYVITDAGRSAFDAMETDEMRGMISEHNARVRERAAPVIDGVAEEEP